MSATALMDAPAELSPCDATPSSAGRTLLLFATANGGRNYFRVIFAGRDDAHSDAMACEYIDRNSGHMSFDVEQREGHVDLVEWDLFPKTFDRLFPTCEHGMSATLCMGPMHFPTHEQEMGLWGPW